MEVDGIEAPVCKFPRISTNGNDHYPVGDQENGAQPRRGLDLSGGQARLYGWPSSRIVRVSRASGGKDRHSKVLTSKGLRDRRVRLSVNTAIQFYDLQDRLGYDQPSKAVEWLLKAASSSISELPPMNVVFPETPEQLRDVEKKSRNEELELDSAQADLGSVEPSYHQNQLQQQQQNMSKSSVCSSNSDTSKGSGLSLSRSETRRVKARERAKERVAEKEQLNPQTSSFTELLSGSMNNVNSDSHHSSPNGSAHHKHHQNGGGSGTSAANESIFFQKQARQWPPMDYFNSGLLGPLITRPGHTHLANQPATLPMFSMAENHHHHHHHHQPEVQHFSFVPDHLVSVPTAGENQNDSNEYNLNFTISSASTGLAGLHRGTLQSNSSSPSLLSQIQRFSPIDGAQGFLIGTTAAPVENHHQFLPGFDSRFHLFYGDGHSDRHSDHKGRAKN